MLHPPRGHWGQRFLQALIVQQVGHILERSQVHHRDSQTQLHSVFVYSYFKNKELYSENPPVPM